MCDFGVFSGWRDVRGILEPAEAENEKGARYRAGAEIMRDAV